MDEFAALLLTALTEGYRARAGMKERARALTEYEIARRAGLTEASYADFSETAQSEQVRATLDELARDGWVTVQQRSGRYDAYVPTREDLLPDLTVDDGSLPRAIVEATAVLAETQPVGSDSLPPATGPYADDPAVVALHHIARQLDEITSLLRAIDAKLERAG